MTALGPEIRDRATTQRTAGQFWNSLPCRCLRDYIHRAQLQNTLQSFLHRKASSAMKRDPPSPESLRPSRPGAPHSSVLSPCDPITVGEAVR